MMLSCFNQRCSKLHKTSNSRLLFDISSLFPVGNLFSYSKLVSNLIRYALLESYYKERYFYQSLSIIIQSYVLCYGGTLISIFLANFLVQNPSFYIHLVRSKLHNGLNLKNQKKDIPLCCCCICSATKGIVFTS